MAKSFWSPLIAKDVRTLIKPFHYRPVLLTDEELLLKEVCKASFYEFVKTHWQDIDTDPFLDNWHIGAMCCHMEALGRRQILDLIMNLPPRTGKTNICYVLFIVWIWINDASRSFLCTSYSIDVSDAQGRKCGEFIAHPRIQRLYGEELKLRVKSQSLIITRMGGERRSTALEGANMGLGANIVMMDDVNSPQQIDSRRLRERANQAVAYIGTTRTRSTPPCRLLTQQRVCNDDATAMLLKSSGWTHLFIPEMFEANRRCTTIVLPGTSQRWTDPRTEEGEKLDESWRGEAFIERARAGLSKYMFQAQYQQNPLLPEGNVLDPQWFKLYRGHTPPEFDYILQSWDTAFLGNEESNTSAFSACTTWGCYQDAFLTGHVMLLDVFSARLSFPQLRDKAIELHAEFKPDEILIERKASGYSLIDELRSYDLPAQGFNPKGSKIKRCMEVSGFIEGGYISIPTKAPDFKYPTESGKDLLEAAQYFPQASPGSDTADIIDSMSQALTKLARRTLLANRATLKKQYRSQGADEPLEE